MKKIVKILSLGIILLSFLSFNVLDFFSSMTKIDYIEGNKTLKFTSKLNTSHLSQALSINPSDKDAFLAEVKKHITENFKVNVNGSDRQIIFDNNGQINGETVWIYFEVSNVPSIESLKFKNTILINNYPKQINIINLSYKGNSKTINFQKGKETGEIKF